MKKDNSEERAMYNAVCSTCGNNCEVPFKPSGKKPILCQQCFDKTRGKSFSNNAFRKKDHRSGESLNSQQFDIINGKLDKILYLITSTLSARFDSDSNSQGETIKPKPTQETINAAIKKLKKIRSETNPVEGEVGNNLSDND
jgi:CxxC-x17-CxxC domain-containing protein